MKDEIVAIATPYGKSGVGVVRISGKSALNIAQKMFVPNKAQSLNVPNKMILGKISLGDIHDIGYLVYFKSPKSYTGEDVVEFQCHGGIVVTQKIVETAISKGARLAEPGEFSKRAFLNGKLTLDRAEGVIDTINAESESELKASSELLRGELAKRTSAMQDKLTDVLSEIEVNLDYPEHDIEYKTKENFQNELNAVNSEILELLATAERGKLIKNGVNVAIVGKTNVGKSSLLNTLLGSEVAIVTDIAGTTRDVVVGGLEYKGMKFNFLDTAGLRETSDFVENIGIEKTKQTTKSADIVLLVLDNSIELEAQDEENLRLTEGKNRLVILNKSDLPNKVNFAGEYIKVSAKKGINIEQLKEKIYQMALGSDNINTSLILTNIRHVNVLSQASEMLKKIILQVLSIPLDCTAMDIKEVWEKLGEITGETVSESIIDRIFSKFCLGK